VVKRIMLVLIIAAGIGIYRWESPAAALEPGVQPVIKAGSALLMDARTGEIIVEQNADEPLPPASMSKMMTEIVVLEHIGSGKIAWDDKVRTSKYAAGVEGAQIGFGPGEQFTVRELFEAMAIHSANDAAVALAEHTAGTETKFTALMNKKAKEIGLSSKTSFGNASGLSKRDLAAYAAASAKSDTVMSARDAARLARYLIQMFPEVLNLTTRNGISLQNSPVELHTTNMMLPGEPFAYQGNDGLKTGYTSQAGYCFTGTTKRGSKRLIAVVMGADTSNARFVETEKLFQYGFGRSGSKTWISKLKLAF
jgi:D-alanyl-D-alanine carboxypeptidase